MYNRVLDKKINSDLGKKPRVVSHTKFPNWLSEFSHKGECIECTDKFQVGGERKFTDDQRREMAQRVVAIAKQRIKDDSYYEVPDELKQYAAAQGDEANGCIGGVCSIYQQVGVMPEVTWSNTDFAKRAKEFGFQNSGYGLKGINNLEPGDMVQYLDVGEKNKNTAYPHHSAILTEIDNDGNYHFFDNYNKKERIFSKSEMEDVLSPSKKKNQYQASIYKVNPYMAPKIGTPDDIQAMQDRADKIKYQKQSGLNYNYNIRQDAKDYNDDTKDIMNKFVNFANNTDNINNLIEKTGMSKEDIHDSLLNVFGELGQEGGWQDKTFTGTMGVEGLMEKFLAKTKVGELFGGGKKKSVGPGQVKFSQIKAEDRKKYGIKSAADLYDLEKLLPLMTAQDLENKQVLRNWGKKNTLSDKLIGVTDNKNPLQADDLKGGVGRWSPYLRNQFSNIQNKKINLGQNDGIPFNEERISNSVPGQNGLISPYKLDEGSYPDKVFYKIDDNLSRNIGPPLYSAPNPDIPLNTITLQDFIVKTTKKPLVRKQDGGQWLHEYQVGGVRSQRTNVKPTVQELANLLSYMENPPDQNLYPKRVGKPIPARPFPTMIPAGNTRQKALTAAGQKIKQNSIADKAWQAKLTKAVDEEAAPRIQERLAAQKVYKDKTTPFQFPTGESKTYPEMDWREKRYVGAKSLEADSRYKEGEESWWDTFSPISWVGSMAANLGSAPYEARQQNSALPYVTSIAAPLLTGRSMGSGSMNPLGKSFWTKTALTDKQFANAIVNPLYGLNPLKSKSTGAVIPQELPMINTRRGPYNPENLPMINTRRGPYNPENLPMINTRRGPYNPENLPMINTRRGPYNPENLPMINTTRTSNIDVNTIGGPDNYSFNVNSNFGTSNPGISNVTATGNMGMTPTTSGASGRPQQIDMREVLRQQREAAFNAAQASRTGATNPANIPSINAINAEYTAPIIQFKNPVIEGKNWDVVDNSSIFFPGNNQNDFFIDPTTGLRVTKRLSQSANNPNITSGDYLVGPNSQSGMHVETIHNTDSPYFNIENIGFFRPDSREAAEQAAKQANFVFRNIPKKANVKEISTSIHSTPLLNAYLSRLTNGPQNAGRVELNDLNFGKLNSLNFNQQGPEYFNELLGQMPKLQRTYKTLGDNLGIKFDDPKIRYDGQDIPLEQFYSPTWQAEMLKKGNAINAYDFRFNAPKFGFTKHWKDGGPIVNEEGYKNGVPPTGSNWRIPGNTLYNPTGFNIWAQPNKGQGKRLNAYDTRNTQFPGADYVDEYHMQNGGQRQSLINLNLPKYKKPSKEFFTGFGFSQNVAPSVNVHGVGGYGEYRPTSNLTLTGSGVLPSVVYPGGSNMFVNPSVNFGMKYKLKNGGQWLNQYNY